MVFDGSLSDSNNLNAPTHPNDQATYMTSNGLINDNSNTNSCRTQNLCRTINYQTNNDSHLCNQAASESRKSYKNDHWHLDYLSSAASLAETLNGYEYLNDYEFCRIQRLKQNALRKYDLIMRSIKSNQCDLSESTSDVESDDEGFMFDEPAFEYSNFNLILKRHRKRIKTQRSISSNHHRH